MALDDQYPIIAMQDRYRGVYSGAWLAIAETSELVDETTTRAQFCLTGDRGPSDGDVDAALFWKNAPDWIAVGQTPDQAIAVLRKKLRLKGKL